MVNGNNVKYTIFRVNVLFWICIRLNIIQSTDYEDWRLSMQRFLSCLLLLLLCPTFSMSRIKYHGDLINSSKDSIQNILLQFFLSAKKLIQTPYIKANAPMYLFVKHICTVESLHSKDENIWSYYLPGHFPSLKN